MTLPYSLEEALSTGLFSRRGFYVPQRRELPNYENHGVYHRFLEIVAEPTEEFFIPAMGIETTMNFIIEHLHDTEPIRVSYPLYVRGYEERKTANAILQAIAKCSGESRLEEIRTSKGLDYYGGSGLIFDEDWNPLMICGFMARIIDRDRLKIEKPICYVSPEVFQNSDLISKAIVKKVIPYLSNNPLSIRVPSMFDQSGTVMYDQEDFTHVEVIIRHLNNLFVVPENPLRLGSAPSDDSIWQFLSDNINELR